jgi:Uma2 family endonuclease
MSAVRSQVAPATPLPELHSGDVMSREEFHRIYEQMPEDFKAELIGGVVYVASPLKRAHGTSHIPLLAVIFAYQSATPGVECADNTTVILGEGSEPQPDIYLRILPECGGRSRSTADDYVDGPPELIVEVANSSRSIDLHSKREDYSRHGVLEYLVLAVKDHRFHWFDLTAAGPEIPVDDGIIRVRNFPGLWIDVQGVLTKAHAKLMETLQRGLATPEHAAFAARLAAARK